MTWAMFSQVTDLAPLGLRTAMALDLPDYSIRITMTGAPEVSLLFVALRDSYTSAHYTGIRSCALVVVVVYWFDLIPSSAFHMRSSDFKLCHILPLYWSLPFLTTFFVDIIGGSFDFCFGLSITKLPRHKLSG